jgi:hypothetical protein
MQIESFYHNDEANFVFPKNIQPAHQAQVINGKHKDKKRQRK